jgi:hypothetical protein
MSVSREDKTACRSGPSCSKGDHQQVKDEKGTMQAGEEMKPQLG